jgi:hypothetical protein
MKGFKNHSKQRIFSFKGVNDDVDSFNFLKYSNFQDGNAHLNANMKYKNPISKMRFLRAKPYQDDVGLAHSFVSLTCLN